MPGRARPESSARAATWDRTRGSIQGSPAATYSGWTVSRSRRVRPASAATVRSRSREGQGRSGFTWSGVSGDTPPKSSMPAASSARHSSRSTRLGGACTRIFGPRTRRVTAMAARYSSSPRSSAERIAVSGLARKFWTMTSCTWPYCWATRRIAKIDSARSVGVSPMPTRMPVVNGTESRPASSRTRSRTAGSLSGEPWCGWPFSVNRRVEVVSSIMPMDGETGLSRFSSAHDMTPGLRCGSRPVSSSTRTAIARR